jgi:formiminotetrahydrofolate cyclodeaminase
MLIDLNLNEFIEITASKEPVPGGGSVSALCGALSAALARMVADLTIGRKKYIDVEDEMRAIVPVMSDARDKFTRYIDEDSDSYAAVMAAFGLPKETELQKEERSAAIQQATLGAAMVPLNVARLAVQIMDTIAILANKGNQNAVTDACVAMMAARTAALGAILNVRINIASLKDTELAAVLAAECDTLHDTACAKEQSLLQNIKI